MKLRVRLAETKETLRIETPDPSSLHDLKTLVAAKLSPAIPSESIRLSLNRKDELVSPSPDDPLQSLGLTSGDLLLFSLAPAGTLNLALSAPAGAANPLTETLDPILPKELPDPREGTSSAPQGYLMDVDSEPPAIKKPPPVPCFLKRVMESENGEARGDLGRLVVAVHAVFLESGFVATGSNGSCLPEGWASASATVSVQYTVPNLVGRNDVKIAVLKFSTMGKYVSVYGFVSRDCPEVYRVCLDVPKLVPLLASAMGGKEEKDVFQLWKIVKEGLSLPLLIDFCEKNGLPLPPCFARLPTELKIRILEFLPGIDVARAACAGSEMRYLSSNDELWKQKFAEEFGLMDERGVIGNSWRDKFVRCWVKQNNLNKRTQRGRATRMPNMFALRHHPLAPHRMIGGDYDLLPAIGQQGLRVGFTHLPGRRNFSPRCNFGGRDTGFNM